MFNNSFWGLKGYLKSGIKIFKINAGKNTRPVYTLKFLSFFLCRFLHTFFVLCFFFLFFPFFQVMPTCFCWFYIETKCMTVHGKIELPALALYLMVKLWYNAKFQLDWFLCNLVNCFSLLFLLSVFLCFLLLLFQMFTFWCYCMHFF